MASKDQSYYVQGATCRSNRALPLAWIATESSPRAQCVVTCIQHKRGARNEFVRFHHSGLDDRAASNKASVRSLGNTDQGGVDTICHEPLC